MSDQLRLAMDFPQPTREDWRSLVSTVLRQRSRDDVVDPETALSVQTYDGFTRLPLYTSADSPIVSDAQGAAATASSTVGDGWDVRQRHADTDPARTNQAVLSDLTNGVTSIWLKVGAQGVPIGDLGRALEGVFLDLAPIVVDAAEQTAAAANALLALADHNGVARSQLRGSLGADPVAGRLRSGVATDVGELAELAHLTAGTGLIPVTVDGTVYHDAGGNDSDELAAVAAVGVAYLRVFSRAGVSDPFEQLEFRYAVTDDQFGSLAKLRAARRIWERICELTDPSGQHRQNQHAVTSTAMLTRRDPWTNMLRSTIACVAAAAGGADAITVAAFDEAVGRSDEFARRIARNTHSIAHDEASLARVMDPAGGSWYVESLTENLATAAWAKFTALERAGGAFVAVESGALADLVGRGWQPRSHNIATRHAPITGVSVFPPTVEDALIREPAVVRSVGGLLPGRRYAEDFEALHDRVDAHTATTGERPRVALAALGPPSAYNGRVMYARDLFEVAGIESLVIVGSAEEITAAYDPASTPVVCVCSSDAVYADEAGTLVTALRTSGAHRILLAGKPGVGVAVDDYVFSGVDALEVLRTTLAPLGVA